MKVLVITAIFGGIDKVKEIPFQNIDFDREIIYEENSPYDFAGLNNRLKAKYFKWQMHKLYPEYDIFIWVDGNVQIKTEHFIKDIVDRVKDNDMLIRLHPSRICIYEEAAFIMNGIMKGDKYLKARYDGSINREVEHFRSQGHPENSNLYWCGLFAVKNNRKMNKVFDDVWQDQILRSNFDQNSFAFHALKNNVYFKIVTWGDFHKNENYELINHSKLI